MALVIGVSGYAVVIKAAMAAWCAPSKYAGKVTSLRISAIVDARFSLLVDGENASPEVFGNRVFLAAGELDQLQDSDISVRRGLEATLRGIVLGAWTVVEVLTAYFSDRGRPFQSDRGR